MRPRIRSRWWCGVAVAVVLGVAGGAFAAAGIEATVTPAEVTVRDPIAYTVTLTVPAGAQVKLPGEKARLDKLEVRGYQATETALPDGMRQIVMQYTLAAFDVGTRELSTFRVPVTAGGRTERYLAPPITVTVKSVLPDKAEVQPKSYYGPVTLPSGWTEWVYAALIALGVMALVVLVVWWLRRRRRTAPEVEEAPLGADEAALRALQRLAAADTVARGDVATVYLHTVQPSGPSRRLAPPNRRNC